VLLTSSHDDNIETDVMKSGDGIDVWVILMENCWAVDGQWRARNLRQKAKKWGGRQFK